MIENPKDTVEIQLGVKEQDTFSKDDFLLKQNITVQIQKEDKQKFTLSAKKGVEMAIIVKVKEIEGLL
jgi:hypothetical protein